ncbi:hypothetical protein J1N35_029133 [Gossypium stocksii]|uniref:Uncharacterized protein n=1 Tax=Gossypium stocksii TaxID=47602 RepID=A0A9D3ZRS6_9ROSI|nr:hypothetical protein J1N35_029133 [Gossypium stocksii]
MDIWLIVERRFATRSSAKLFSLKHMLYYQKEGQLSISDYMSKLKQMCDILVAAGNGVSDQEHINVILAGLPVKYELVRVVASATNLSLDFLTELLVDCESRQLDLWLTFLYKPMQFKRGKVVLISLKILVLFLIKVAN